MISSIDIQPAAGKLSAAYSPIIYELTAGDSSGGPTPPVVYCDIYINGVYYRSMTKTQAKTHFSTHSIWSFDVRQAAQEYLKKYLPILGGDQVLEAPALIASIKCKFRASGYDPAGFISPEGITPIQATGNTPAVAGTGTESNESFIVNIALQHGDNKNLETHLGNYKTGQWSVNAFPLTHRPLKYYINEAGSDYFPAIFPDNLCFGGLKLNYRYRGQTTIWSMISGLETPCNAVIFDLVALQVPGSQDVNFTWKVTGNATLTSYSVDGGPWINVAIVNGGGSGSAFVLFLGQHTIRVKGICLCAEGDETLLEFAIVDPVDFNCAAGVTDLVANQTGPGELVVNFVMGVGAVAYEGQVAPAGGGQILLYNGSSASPTFTAQGAPLGDNDITVIPFCANGVEGTPMTITKRVLGFPTINKIDETTTGPGGIRTQVFRIGGSITSGNRFVLSIYGVDVVYITSPIDTATMVAAALRDLINANLAPAWDAAGLAPAPGTVGFPPAATALGSDLTVTMNYLNSFAYNAYLF